MTLLDGGVCLCMRACKCEKEREIQGQRRKQGLGEWSSDFSEQEKC